VRTLGAVIFIAWRLGWMATAMYVPSLAINAASGGTVDLNTVTIVVGTLVTLYTMLGGIQAVIWNDVIQFCIMFGGLAATAAIVIVSVPGGIPEIFSLSSMAGKLDAWPSLVDPSAVTLADQVASFFAQPMTAVSLLVALIVGRMAQYTSDQVMVQRLQTTKSLADTRRAFVVNAAGDALWMIGLSFIGFALFAYFETHSLPIEYQTDKLLPYFMSLEFPAGAVGLVIAAIMAASLSSIDSAINSCSSVAVVDLYNRLWLKRDVERAGAIIDQRHQVMVSRIATLIFGVVGTTLACNVSRFGNLIEINNRLVNAFTGPLFGIYLLAMFSRKSRSSGVLIAGVAGAVVSYYIAYHSAVGFLWPSTFGLAATIIVGLVAAAIRPAPSDSPGRTLTWRAVLATPVA
jgi:Na+/proline symporter